MLDAETGECLATGAGKDGHKDTIYSIVVTADGKLVASGGADKNIIIWVPADYRKK